jgi:PAS domain S-box-containing protein
MAVGFYGVGVAPLKPDHSKLAKLWRWLTEPGPTVQEPARRRVQMLIAFLVLLAPLGLLVGTLPAFFGSQRSIFQDTQFRITLVATLCVFALYGLSRTRFYRLTPLLTVIFISLAIVLASIAEEEVDYDILFYLVIPTLFTGIFLSMWGGVLLLAVNVVCLLLLPLVRPSASLATIASEPLSFVVVVSAAVLLMSHFRNQIEAERQGRLAKSEQRFSQIFHAGPVAAGISTLAEGRIVDVNEQFLRLFGYQRDEMIGRLTSEVNIWGEPALREGFVAALRERGGMDSVEIQLRTRSGKLLDILMSVQTIELDGAPCMLAMGVDITQLKKADREHRERERIEIELRKERELGEIKRRFLTTAAHEFRTPLAIILASSELLELYLDRLTPERRASNFATIRAQVMSLGAMLDDMRTILDVEAGSVHFDPMPHDLSRLCHDLVSEVQGSLGIKHTLVFSAEGDLAAIPVDAGLFERIVRNLLSNAIKFSPPGSEIRVAVCREGNTAVLTVSDDGVGIPVKDQPRIFEPYHRAENAFNIPGIGLGLKIVRDFVRLHGGSITFTSEEGKGTTFAVELPVEDSKARAI